MKETLYTISVASIMAWLICFMVTLSHQSHYLLIITIVSFMWAVNMKKQRGIPRGIPNFKMCPPPPKITQEYITFLENELDRLKEENGQLKMHFLNCKHEKI